MEFMLAHPYLFTSQIVVVSIIFMAGMDSLGKAISGKVVYKGDIHHVHNYGTSKENEGETK